MGLGHAHLFVLEALARGRLRGVRAVLVTPPGYDYSGMIPGIVAGCYGADAGSLEPGPLARAAGAEWVPGRAREILPDGVVLESGARVGGDLVSVGIGSVPAGGGLPGVAEHTVPVKPIREVLRFRAEAERAVERAGPAAPAEIAVVGGGAAGVEVALCLAVALARRHGRDRFRLRLLERGDRVLAGYPDALRETALALLRERGGEARTGVAVRGAGAGWLDTETGERIDSAATLWATGPAPPPLLRGSPLPVDDAGWLRVLPTLQAEGHPRLFGAGDCVSIRGLPWVERAGVYAVREGPVLARNLARVLEGREPEPFRPQRHWLSLLNTGDGRALLRYRALSLHGRLAWRLKDRIDRRFVERFRALAG